jgi:ATP-dependent Zn protease
MNRKSKEVWLTALHEAGHAVLQELFFPGKEYEVDIIGFEGLAYGKTAPSSTGWKYGVSTVDKLHQIQKALAGIVAESIETGKDWHNPEGGSKDIEAACNTFGILHFRPGVGGHADRARSCLADPKGQLASHYNSTKALLLEHWNEVNRIAESLMSKQKMTGNEIRNILTAHGGDSRK